MEPIHDSLLQLPHHSSDLAAAGSGWAVIAVPRPHGPALGAETSLSTHSLLRGSLTQCSCSGQHSWKMQNPSPSSALLVCGFEEGVLGRPMVKSFQSHLSAVGIVTTGSSASELLKSLPTHLSQHPAHLASTPNFQFTHYLTIITKINNPPKLIMFFPMLQPLRQNLI